MLILSNFSCKGEVANMTLTEVKEVAPRYFSVEVNQKLLQFSPSNNILSFVSFLVLWGNVLQCNKEQTVMILFFKRKRPYYAQKVLSWQNVSSRLLLFRWPTTKWPPPWARHQSCSRPRTWPSCGDTFKVAGTSVPTADMAEVFITSSGAALTPSHLKKFINTGLGKLHPSLWQVGWRNLLQFFFFLF